jgi:hypothetical protein
MTRLPFTGKVLRMSFLALLLLLPLLPVLRQALPELRFGDQSLVGLSKELIVVFAVAVTAMQLALSGRMRLDGVTLVLLVFVGWALLRTVVTLAPPLDAINGMRHAFLYALLCVAALLYVRNTGVQLGLHPLDPAFFRMLLLQLLVVCGVGYVEYAQPLTRVFLYGERSGELQTGVPGLADVRLVSLLENPINLGLYLCAALTLLFPGFSAMRGWRRMGFWLVYLFALPILVMTLSRAAYAVIALLTVFFAWRFTASGRGGAHLAGVVLAASLGAVAYAAATGRIDVDDLIEPVVYRIESHLSVEAVSEDPRIENWSAFADFLSRDLSVLAVFGGGVGLSDPSGARGTFRVENSYMTLLGELGLPALALFVYLLARSVRLSLHRARRAGRGERDCYLAWAAFFATYALAALTLDAHRNSPFSFYLWLCVLALESGPGRHVTMSGLQAGPRDRAVAPPRFGLSGGR